MLRATGISHGYGADPLFRDVNLTIGAGQRVGLVGPNGTGKSTLLRVLARVETPDAGYVEHAPGTRIGWYVQQVPDPDATVGGFLAAAPGELAELERELRSVEPALAGAGAMALARHAALVERFGMLGGWAYRARVDEVLDRLDVADLAPERRLGSLSGGQQARLMLARVLLAEPNLLILDEPTNHLDAAGIAWLGRYLAGFPGGVLVVSHDRAFLDEAVRRVVELDGIRPEPQDYPGGGYSAYRQEKRRRWEGLLLEYEAQEKRRRRLEQDIERTRAHALGVELSTRNDRLRRYAKKVARKAKARQRRLETQMRRAAWIAEPRTRPPLTLAFDGPAEDTGAVAVHGLGVEVAGRYLLRDVDLCLRSGERLLVTGANGAGKSTLLAALAGRLAPSAGTVDVAGGAALLPQVHDALPVDRTVLGYFRSQVPVYEQDAEALLAAHLFDEHTWHRPLGRLSAGELRRLVLATLVNRPAGALLLDEPTNFLDFDALEVLEEALAGYRGTLVAVTHDRYLARALRPDRVVDIADGVLREA